MNKLLVIIQSFIQSHPYTLITLGILSITAFFGTILLIPYFIISIPEDYFIEKDLPEKALNKKTVSSIIFIILKNILGSILLLAGILMLVLPGQGLLTILLGLMIMDFPGKRMIEIRFIRNNKILKTINYIRAKAGRLPMKINFTETK